MGQLVAVHRQLSHSLHYSLWRSDIVPSPALYLATAAGAHDPLHQCLAVNAWSIGVLGVAFPLIALDRLQRRAHRAYQLQQRQQRRGWAPVPPACDAEALESVRWLYLASVLAWAAGSTLALQTA